MILPTTKTSKLKSHDMHIASRPSRPDLNNNSAPSNLHNLIIYKKYRSFQSKKLSRVRGSILPREACECVWACAQFVKCFGTKQVSNQRKFSFAHPELNSSLRVTSHKPTKISIRINFQDFKLSWSVVHIFSCIALQWLANGRNQFLCMPFRRWASVTEDSDRA